MAWIARLSICKFSDDNMRKGCTRTWILSLLMLRLRFLALKQVSLVHGELSVAQDAVQCRTLQVLRATRGAWKWQTLKRSDKVLRNQSYKIENIYSRMLINARFDEDHLSFLTTTEP